MNYLAIDFGTANCAAVGHRDEELVGITLEGNSLYLPSVLHANRIETKASLIDEREFRARVEEALRDERARVVAEERELKLRLDNFQAKKGPPQIPLAPMRANFRSEAEFSEAVREHEKLRRSRIVALQEFTEGPLAEEIINQRRFLRPLASRETVESIVRAVMVRESASESDRQYWEQSFADVVGNREATVSFGTEAYRRFAADPLGGFYLRSPKAFLGSNSLNPSLRKFFTATISRILSFIKEAAENQCGCRYDGVVIGRPVNYLGAANDVGNTLALKAMKEASEMAGFLQTRFVFEPMAAALTINRTELAAYETIFIVDIGGGTTDCVVLDVGFDRFLVRAAYGERIGGNDLDESIAWKRFMPTFGKDGLLENGRPIPYEVIRNAVSTRDIPSQQRFKNAGVKIEELLRDAKDKESIQRLKRLQENQLQHRVLMASEEAKIALSSNDTFAADLSFIEFGLQVSIDKRDMLDAVSDDINKICSVANKCLQLSQINRGILTFVTGGLSHSRDVILALKSSLPSGSQVAILPALGSVATGLGLVARSLSWDGVGLSASDEIYGVPILR